MENNSKSQSLKTVREFFAKDLALYADAQSLKTVREFIAKDLALYADEIRAWKRTGLLVDENVGSVSV